MHPLLHRHSLADSVNKPDPRVAQHILQSWDVIADTSADTASAGTVWFVGDSMDDMLCGKAAGCRTCLISTDTNKDLYSSRRDVIDLCVHSLQEFAGHIGLQ
jgi:phosphoglycolate phosphatase-like HAD superfamily hydrolase